MVGRWECVEGKKGNDKSSRRGDDASQATPGGELLLSMTLWGGGETIKGPPRMLEPKL